MASQLVFNGVLIELEETIEYTMNTGNIADMSLSKSNYTEAFKIPKISLQAVKAFDGLSIPADLSYKPYIIQNIDVLDNYAYVYSGNLVLIGSDELYYNATVLNGTFNIFSLMGDQTFADVPAVRDILPLKTTANVAAMVQGSGTDVIFSIANYGGITNMITSTETRINIDCMPVAYNQLFLWQSIFNHIGVFQDVNGELPDMTEQYFTFPYPPLNSNAMGMQHFIGTLPTKYENLSGSSNPSDYSSWIDVTRDSNFTVSGGSLQCQVSGLYNFTFKNFYAYGQGNVGGSNKNFPLNIQYKRNGTVFYTFEASMNNSSTSDDVFANAVQQFNVGDILTIGVVKTVQVDSGANWNFFHFDSTMTITDVQLNDETVKSILSFKLSDYVKEFMYKYALIGFSKKNYLDFVSIKNILESEAIDWTKKYVKRTNEVYDIGWNQHNWLRHKYVNEESDYYDRDIPTFNENVPVSRTMIDSKIFVPSQNLGRFDCGGIIGTNNYVMVNAYLTYTADNSNKVKTENRNFWLQARKYAILNTVFGSFTMGDILAYGAASIYISDEFEYSFRFNPNYDPLYYMVQYARQHTIELKLTSVDIAVLEQDRLYFFQQEAAYYMLNTLKYKNKEVATGTFTKVRR